jgi:hypothetical protein
MKFAARFLLAGLVNATVALHAQTPQPSESTPRRSESQLDPIVGYWSFFANNVTEVKKDGTLSSSTGLGGKWELIKDNGAERIYKFVWANGRYGGTLSLAPDRNRLSGRNQSNVAVAAVRLIIKKL